MSPSYISLPTHSFWINEVNQTVQISLSIPNSKLPRVMEIIINDTIVHPVGQGYFRIGIHQQPEATLTTPRKSNKPPFYPTVNMPALLHLAASYKTGRKSWELLTTHFRLIHGFGRCRSGDRHQPTLPSMTLVDIIVKSAIVKFPLICLIKVCMIGAVDQMRSGN